MSARTPSDAERKRMLEELAAVPKPERLSWLAELPEDRRSVFRRILAPADQTKLDAMLLAKARAARQPTLASWLEDARAGRATTPDAMIEVLLEIRDRLRPTDAQWVDRIQRSTAGRGYSRKQAALIRGVYDRYYGSATEG